jgi:glycosyltransferase involved in cell wall biosynthesis
LEPGQPVAPGERCRPPRAAAPAQRLAARDPHNVALEPVLLGTTASLVSSATGVANSPDRPGLLFIGEAKVNGSARAAVRYALSRLLRRKRSRTIVQNPEDRAFVVALGAPPESVVLIPGSGVDTNHFTPLPEPPPPVTAAYVGRMLADKGVVTLIEAFSLLGKREEPLQLLLAGDCDRENPGSLAPEQLREFASLYGIEWLGHVAEIRKVWARAHFVVLASRREGLPKSLSMGRLGRQWSRPTRLAAARS